MSTHNEPEASAGDGASSDARDLPQEIVTRPATATKPQHRPAPADDSAKAACGVDLYVTEHTYTFKEFNPAKELCQHQSCFGGDKLPLEDVVVDVDLTEYESPLVQSTNGGRIHKPADNIAYPSCDVRLQSGHWVVVEGANLDFEDGDAERCWHQECFGPIEHTEG